MNLELEMFKTICQWETVILLIRIEKVAVVIGVIVRPFWLVNIATILK